MKKKKPSKNKKSKEEPQRKRTEADDDESDSSILRVKAGGDIDCMIVLVAMNESTHDCCTCTECAEAFLRGIKISLQT